MIERHDTTYVQRPRKIKSIDGYAQISLGEVITDHYLLTDRQCVLRKRE